LAWKTKNFKISFLQIHFMRAARTDKGVSAVGQVVSLMMVVNPPGIIDRINAELPPAIRAYGFRRTVKGFDARKACDKRRYEYILPVWMFDPKMEGIYRPKLKKKTQEGEGAKEGEEEDEIEEIEAAAAVVKEEVNDEAPTETMPTGQPYGSDSDFVFDDACIQRLNDILSSIKALAISTISPFALQPPLLKQSDSFSASPATVSLKLTVRNGSVRLLSDNLSCFIKLER
jgi:tRNA U38,U39,U40 pseudouridine synthase TruA